MRDVPQRLPPVGRHDRKNKVHQCPWVTAGLHEKQMPQPQVSLSQALREVTRFECPPTNHTQGTQNQQPRCLATELWISQALRKLTTTEQISLDLCLQVNVSQESPGICIKYQHKKGPNVNRRTNHQENRVNAGNR